MELFVVCALRVAVQRGTFPSRPLNRRLIVIRRVLSVVLLSLAVFTVMGAAPAWSQITESQRLNFGEWLVTNNNASHSVTVETNGTYSNSPSLVMLTPPQQGIYQVQGLPNGAVINSVTVLMTQPMEGPGSEDFVMDNFTTVAPNPVGGNTTITLGARARTSGNGNSYGDGSYTGELTLEINL
jgi:hypothetical protein